MSAHITSVGAMLWSSSGTWKTASSAASVRSQTAASAQPTPERLALHDRERRSARFLDGGVERQRPSATG